MLGSRVNLQNFIDETRELMRRPPKVVVVWSKGCRSVGHSVIVCRPFVLVQRTTERDVNAALVRAAISSMGYDEAERIAAQYRWVRSMQGVCVLGAICRRGPCEHWCSSIQIPRRSWRICLQQLLHGRGECLLLPFHLVLIIQHFFASAGIGPLGCCGASPRRDLSELQTQRPDARHARAKHRCRFTAHAFKCICYVKRNNDEVP